jgi:hypothetical protein
MSARRSFVTRRRARSLLLVATVVLAPAGALAGDVALEPFAGFQYGGAFHSESGRRAAIGIGLQYGANLDIPFEENRWGIDLLFARQESELEDVPRLGIAIERYMVGIREEKGDGRFRFRGNFYLGASRFILDGLGSDVRFTGALGLGTSHAVSPRFGLRVDARAYYAVVSFSGGTACVNGSCLYVFGGSGVWQGDVTAGLELRF